MQFDLSFIISLSAIVVMLFCLMQVIKLGKTVPGGIVGKAWRQLSALVVCSPWAIWSRPSSPCCLRKSFNPSCP